MEAYLGFRSANWNRAGGKAGGERFFKRLYGNTVTREKGAVIARKSMGIRWKVLNALEKQVFVERALHYIVNDSTVHF